MEMMYEEFIGKLRLVLKETMQISEEKIYFQEKGGPYTPTGDKLFIELVGYDGTKEVCGFYAEDLYEHYCNDVSLEEIAEIIMIQLKKVSGEEFVKIAERLSTYEKAKDYLFIRPLNLEKHEESLKGAVYAAEGEIALVLYMKISEDGGVVNSTKVMRRFVAGWGKNVVEVFKEAIYNTYRMSPPRIYEWKKLLYNPAYEGEEFMEKDINLKKDAVRGNCLSTVNKTNGAVAVFLPGVAKRLSQLLDGDLYLAFTSIHEVMVHNANLVTSEDLKEVLADTIQEATTEEEYLSSHIYHYSQKTGEFTCL